MGIAIMILNFLLTDDEEWGCFAKNVDPLFTQKVNHCSPNTHDKFGKKIEMKFNPTIIEKLPKLFLEFSSLLKKDK